MSRKVKAKQNQTQHQTNSHLQGTKRPQCSLLEPQQSRGSPLKLGSTPGRVCAKLGATVADRLSVPNV